MDIHQAAACINGNQYRDEVPRDLRERMRQAGLVAIFGASDDLTVLEGALRDEMGAHNGASHRLNKGGFHYNRCDCDDCPNFAKLPDNITAQWDERGYSWFIDTEIPHAEFVIMEDDEPYCRGVVVAVADLPE